jgi:hypothetical protein
MLLIDEPGAAPGDADALIEEARRRTRKRRRRIAVVLVIAAAGVAYLLGGGGASRTGGGQSHVGGSAVSIAFSDGHFSAGGMPVGIALRLGPGGHRGATAYFRYGASYVIDDDVPGRGERVLVRWDSAPADRDTAGRITVAIVGPGVAAVRAAGYGTFSAHHVSGLPAAYKAVVFYYTERPALASERSRTRQRLARLARAQAHALAQLPALTPLSAAGTPMASASSDY